jgi:hypothetical protein
MNRIRISIDDIKVKKEDALDTFYSGIKSSETKRTMIGNLRKFLVDACDELLTGEYKERAQQFADLTKENQDKATSIVITYDLKYYDENHPRQHARLSNLQIIILRTFRIMFLLNYP